MILPPYTWPMDKQAVGKEAVLAHCMPPATTWDTGTIPTTGLCEAIEFFQALSKAEHHLLCVGHYVIGCCIARWSDDGGEEREDEEYRGVHNAGVSSSAETEKGGRGRERGGLERRRIHRKLRSNVESIAL